MKFYEDDYQLTYFPDIILNKSVLMIPNIGITYPSPKFYVALSSRWKAFYQFEYVVSGKGYIELEGKIFPVKEGDFFFINKNVFRTLYSDQKDPFKKLHFSISGKFADGIVSAYELNDPLIICKADVYQNFNTMLQIIKNAELYTTEIENAIGDEFLKIVRKVHSVTAEKKKTKTDIAEEIMDHLEWHISDKITISDLSESFFLGKTQIIKIFKQKYGITPMKYIHNRKIELAKFHLETSDVQITRIHEMIGFCDERYFSAAFKSSTGMSPREYRKKYKNK